MSKLLRADFVRLFKSGIFWFGAAAMAGLAGFVVFTRWSDMQAIPGYSRPADSLLFNGGMYIGIVIAVFMGIFVGQDYSGGTIRNKHIIGHSRMAMYLSNLIICFTASIMIYFAFVAVITGSSALGIIGGFEMPLGKMAELHLTTVFAIMSISSILLLISMLIPNKAAGVVTGMILAIFLIGIANTIDYRLTAKEYTQPYSFTVTNADGTQQEIEQPSMKNPKYLTGTKREVFQFFHDTLPVDQIMQEFYEENAFEKNYPLRSLCVAAIVTGTGIFLFHRKDLK